MRDKLNNSPMAQVGLVVVLLVVAAVLLLGKSGGGEEAESEAVVATVNGATATGSTAGEAVEGAVESLEEGGAAPTESSEMPTSVPAPPPPPAVTAAYDSGNTVVLLILQDGGTDHALRRAATDYVAGLPDTTLFVVPVRRVARYAAITVGLDLNRVPAMVVMRPRGLSGGIPQATVDYGFQTPESIVQAVRDASYSGPETTYHPD